MCARWRDGDLPVKNEEVFGESASLQCRERGVKIHCDEVRPIVRTSRAGGVVIITWGQQQGTSADDVDVGGDRDDVDDTNGVFISFCMMIAVVRMIADGDAGDDGCYGDADVVVMVVVVAI
eukprot:7698430-Pyramimonas_sp.AAC.1